MVQIGQGGVDGNKAEIAGGADGGTGENTLNINHVRLQHGNVLRSGNNGKGRCAGAGQPRLGHRIRSRCTLIMSGSFDAVLLTDEESAEQQNRTSNSKCKRGYSIRQTGGGCQFHSPQDRRRLAVGAVRAVMWLHAQERERRTRARRCDVVVIGGG